MINSTARGHTPHIADLWNNGTEEQWKAALSGYYSFPHVSIEMEKYMDTITPDKVKEMSSEDFYNFLHDKYFPWKFTSHRSTIRGYLEEYDDTQGKNILYEIKERMLNAYLIAPEDTELLLCVVTGIKGLGVIGASGLLAIIFPQHYGTLDRFVVESLKKIRDLPEYEKIKTINPADIKPKSGSVIENILRKKAKELNTRFSTDEWTPKKIDMILWYIDRTEVSKDV